MTEDFRNVVSNILKLPSHKLVENKIKMMLLSFAEKQTNYYKMWWCLVLRAYLKDHKVDEKMAEQSEHNVQKECHRKEDVEECVEQGGSLL